jgi:hypothetical protein
MQLMKIDNNLENYSVHDSSLFSKVINMLEKPEKYRQISAKLGRLTNLELTPLSLRRSSHESMNVSETNRQITQNASKNIFKNLNKNTATLF